MPNVSLDGEALIFLDEVNAYRLQNGLVAVGASPTLTTAAQRHADDMAENEFMAHEGSDGSTPHERAEDAGYTGSSTSENVARGFDTGVEVLFGWQSSVTGHNEAMLEPRVARGRHRAGAVGRRRVVLGDDVRQRARLRRRAAAGAHVLRGGEASRSPRSPRSRTSPSSRTRRCPR